MSVLDHAHNIEWIAKSWIKTQSLSIGNGGIPTETWLDRCGASATIAEVWQAFLELLCQRGTKHGKEIVIDDLVARGITRCDDKDVKPRIRTLEEWCVGIAKIALHRVLNDNVSFTLEERIKIGGLTGANHSNYLNRWQWLELEFIDTLQSWVMLIDYEIGEYRKNMRLVS